MTTSKARAKDYELEQMKRAYNAIAVLDYEGRARAMEWLVQRLESEAAEAMSAQRGMAGEP